MGFSTKASKEQILATQRAILALKRVEEFYDHLRTEELYPHDGQILILKKFLHEGIEDLMAQCGRNFGKSVTMMIWACLEAGLRPNSRVFVVAPLRTQAKEIYWESRLAERVIPPNWLEGGDSAFNGTELRIKLSNKSFIKFDGSDNENAGRGIKPTAFGADEFQDWRLGSWDAMKPNFLANNCKVFKIGTPPDRENHFTDEAAFIKKQMSLRNPRYFFLQRPTSSNPTIPRARLEEWRQAYLDRGEEAIWRREYLAEFVPGGATSVFPMFNTDDHVRDIEWIEAELLRDKHKLDYLTIFDPSGSRFAVGFFAYNRYTAKMYLLDELVETDSNFLAASLLWKRVEEIEKRHYHPRAEPIRIYDEQASLFEVEMANLGVCLGPTQKKQNEKSNNISLIRDALAHKKFVIASHCKDAIWEFFNYHTDDKGKIVKKKDDMIDTCLYCFAESGYNFTPQPDTITANTRSFYTPEEEHFRKDRDEIAFEAHHDEPLDEDFFDESMWH